MWLSEEALIEIEPQNLNSNGIAAEACCELPRVPDNEVFAPPIRPVLNVA